MKLPSPLNKLSRQVWLMILVIIMLLVMIVTRWSYTTRTAGDAFRHRFIPGTEQDSVR